MKFKVFYTCNDTSGRIATVVETDSVDDAANIIRKRHRGAIISKIKRVRAGDLPPYASETSQHA